MLEIIPSRYSERPVSTVILDSVRLTISSNRHYRWSLVLARALGVLATQQL